LHGGPWGEEAEEDGEATEVDKGADEKVEVVVRAGEFAGSWAN